MKYFIFLVMALTGFFSESWAQITTAPIEEVPSEYDTVLAGNAGVVTFQAVPAGTWLLEFDPSVAVVIGNSGSVSALGGGFWFGSLYNIVSDAPHGAVLFRTKEGDPWGICRQTDKGGLLVARCEVETDENGEFQLTINDSDPSNNQGFFRFKGTLVEEKKAE